MAGERAKGNPSLRSAATARWVAPSLAKMREPSDVGWGRVVGESQRRPTRAETGNWKQAMMADRSGQDCTLESEGVVGSQRVGLA